MSRWTDRQNGPGPSSALSTNPERPSLTVLREAVVAVVKEHGLRRCEEPITLSSGVKSHWYMNGKRGLAIGRDLREACKAIIELADEQGVDFDAVGGLTLGADAYATGIAMEADKKWFVVRKKPKEHGLKKRIE